MARKAGWLSGVVALTIAVRGIALSQGGSPSGTDLSGGPSLQDLTAWFKRELPVMGSDQIFQNYKNHTTAFKYGIDRVSLSDCRLSLRQVMHVQDAPNDQTRTTVISLKDVNVSALSVSEFQVAEFLTVSKPSFRVQVSAIADRGQPFVRDTENYSGGPTHKSVSSDSIRVRDEDAANRLSGAIRRAALLCSAPDGVATAQAGTAPATPSSVHGRYLRKGKSGDFLQLSSDGTFYLLQDGHRVSGQFNLQGDKILLTSPQITGQPTAVYLGNSIRDDEGIVWEKEAAPPMASSGGRLTNADVVQMAGAGLSDEVIVTSIRQARERDFDLTPTGLIALKKARVSEVVMQAMQTSAGSAQPPPVPTRQARYDPSLAAPPRSTDTSGSSAPCAGVELMGLFKEDMRPMGPLIVYLAKIRNGTSMARIVSLQWLDMYGSPMRTTVQIGAGQIATVQLSMNQPHERQPIELQLTACQ